MSIKEYLLLSAMAYSNLEESSYGKTLYELLEADETKIDGFSFSKRIDSKIITMKYFERILKEWRVFYIDNKRAKILEKDSTGFYSIVFKNIITGQYVIAFRGSEKYPLEDAYKDFIENDIKIGLGIKPVQFYNGVDIYNKMIDEFKINKEMITLTGHSLGGGIAQFVAITSDRERDYIPTVYTWNSIGINRDGIVNLFDFFDYDKILDRLNLTIEEKKVFFDFKDEYLNFFFKEMKKRKIIRDNNTLLISSSEFPNSLVNEELIKSLFKTTKLEDVLKKVSISTQERLLKDNMIFNTLFEVKNVKKELLRASDFIKEIKNNTRYETKIYNYCHSDDLTVSLFKHIGSVYQVEKEFQKKEVKKKTFLANLLFLTKSVQNYHNHEIFLPFVINSGQYEGMFSQIITNNYLSSLIRKSFMMEYYIEKEVLGDYFSFIDITDKNFERIKKQVLKGLQNCEMDILYKKQAIKKLKEIELEEFKEVWEELKRKLASPYRPQDIYDLMLF